MQFKFIFQNGFATFIFKLEPFPLQFSNVKSNFVAKMQGNNLLKYLLPGWNEVGNQIQRHFQYLKISNGKSDRLCTSERILSGVPWKALLAPRISFKIMRSRYWWTRILARGNLPLADFNCSCFPPVERISSTRAIYNPIQLNDEKFLSLSAAPQCKFTSPTHAENALLQTLRWRDAR